jgi:hypothetical protein
MTRAIERVSVTGITRLLRSLTGGVTLKQSKRAKIFVAGRKAAGKIWRAKVAPATEAVWVRRAVSEIVVAKVWGIEAVG